MFACFQWTLLIYLSLGLLDHMLQNLEEAKENFGCLLF